MTLFLNMHNLPKKVAKINQLIKIDNSSFNYSGENKIVLTLRYSF